MKAHPLADELGFDFIVFTAAATQLSSFAATVYAVVLKEETLPPWIEIYGWGWRYAPTKANPKVGAIAQALRSPISFETPLQPGRNP
ncbi:hypothetical protein C8B47_15405 [filamentous cyanobacterium CCP4]|nr:hypothetical protein C8B47_15405 [filamentous cyanobacterium CCP4]